MFGEKARKIAELQQTNDELDKELTEIRPWTGIAKVLQERTAAFAAETDIETAVNLAVQQTGEEERHKFVVAAFQQLNPERQLEILSDTFGDGLIKEALEAEREKRLSSLDKNSGLENILKYAKEHRRFKFTDLPVDAKVVLTFHEKGKIDHNPHGPWKRLIKGVVETSGKLTVLNDELSDIYYRDIFMGRYRHDDFHSITVGVPNKPDTPLHYGAAVRIPKPHSEGYVDDVDLGAVIINGIDIFGAVSREDHKSQLGITSANI